MRKASTPSAGAAESPRGGEAALPPPLPASLRLLKALVILLLIVMILAVPSVVWLLAKRLPPGGGGLDARAQPVLPPALALPPGTEVKAVTFGQGFVAVLSGEDVLFLFDGDGRLLQQLALQPEG